MDKCLMELLEKVNNAEDAHDVCFTQEEIRCLESDMYLCMLKLRLPVLEQPLTGNLEETFKSLKETNGTHWLLRYCALRNNCLVEKYSKIFPGLLEVR